MVKSRRSHVMEWILTILGVGVGITMLVPLIWMVSTSMKYEADVFKFPIEWIPSRINVVENFKEVWGKEYNFGSYYLNTIKITVLSTVFQLLVSSLAAYGFTKIQWRWRDRMFLVYLATMMIPAQVTVVPQFVLLQRIGLYNTHTGIVMMMAFSVYGVFMMRQCLLGIPESLSESAKIDGASHMQIFFRIMLPLMQPTLVTLGIIKFVSTWNDYQTPLIFLNDRKLFTIQLGMRMFATEAGSYYSLIMAAAVSAILPLILVFLLGQKYVIEGITAGAVKG